MAYSLAGMVDGQGDSPPLMKVIVMLSVVKREKLAVDLGEERLHSARATWENSQRDFLKYYSPFHDLQYFDHLLAPCLLH